MILVPHPRLHRKPKTAKRKLSRVDTEVHSIAAGFVCLLPLLADIHFDSTHHSTETGPNLVCMGFNNNIKQPLPCLVPIPTSQSTNTLNTTFYLTNLSSPSLADDSLPVGVQIKDEPQTVPNSPSFCPVDMDDQERQKLERKRQRNRVAASKCRKRKLERISKLEDKVKVLKGENSDLGSVVMNLKQHVVQLKQQILEHVNAGCRIPFQQF